MNKENNTEIELCSIKDLEERHFEIPAYQRGYRWTKLQVDQLLDDLKEFCANKTQDFYCLQPLVLQKKDDKYFVLDGQQRLTTIYMILSNKKELCKSYKKYFITYSTGESLESIIQNIESDDFVKNDIDLFYMQQAWKNISEWFNDPKNDGYESYIMSALTGRMITEVDGKRKDSAQNVRVIWYCIDDKKDDPSDVFTRLNIGKIPLTNSELIKALFLSKDNLLSNDDCRINDIEIRNRELELKQLNIASEWNEMSKKLQNEKFWYFIANKEDNDKYEDRFEYIFDLMSEKYEKKNEDNDTEFYYTFNYFNSILSVSKEKKSQRIITIWNEVKKYFLTLEEWYNNEEYYHYFGYLIRFGLSINTIKNAYETNTKDVIKEKFIIPQIKETLKKNNEKIELSADTLADLEYPDSRIGRVLLLFNIESILKSDKSDIRFPFDKYKLNGWDIEHVCSQHGKKLIFKNEQIDWINDMLEYFTGSSIESNVISFINALKKQNSDQVILDFCSQLLELKNMQIINSDRFYAVYDQMQKYFKENEQIEEIDSISNLALLNQEINRSYGNAFFPVKRNYIIKNDKNGVFIPIATKNLFLKYYSKKMSDAMYWRKEDADSYLSIIKDMLKEFLA